MSKTKVLIALAVAGILAGCAVGPDYREPELPLPKAFVHTEAPTPVAADQLAQFWTTFGDATLDDLMKDALLSNLDLRIALSRVDEARALRGAARLDLAPTITASAGYTEQRIAGAQSAAFGGGAANLTGYDAGVDAFWELDVFGRARRALQASNADLDATHANLADTQVIVAAELSRSYFELRGEQQRLAVARRNVDNQNESLGLTRALLDAGRGTEFDTSRATAQLAATRASIAPLEASVARIIHRLSVLTGREPNALRERLSLPVDLPAVPDLRAVGEPAELLRRRPDIRVSERALAASTARIGVAIGDLFPRVSFTGGLGVAAVRFDDLDASGSDTHLIAPGISWAFLDLGRVRARIAAARARNDGALAAYEQTVLRALQETEDALVTHAHARQRLVELAQSAEASRTAARLARLRFENGAIDFLQVLDAERTLLVAEDSLAQGRADTATSLVAVYKALGGGWTAPVARG